MATKRIDPFSLNPLMGKIGTGLNTSEYTTSTTSTTTVAPNKMGDYVRAFHHLFLRVLVLIDPNLSMDTREKLVVDAAKLIEKYKYLMNNMNASLTAADAADITREYATLQVGQPLDPSSDLSKLMDLMRTGKVTVDTRTGDNTLTAQYPTGTITYGK